MRDDLATLLSERFAPTRSAPASSARPPGPRPLPVGTTSLVGRTEAIDELADLLTQADVRMVTLTGPGGIGKTRLALAVGERLHDRLGIDPVFVPLATVTLPAAALTGMCRALGAELGVGPPLQTLTEQLGDGRWLFILDNLEQVVEVANDLDELLTRCPGVAILVTSSTVAPRPGRARIPGVPAAVARRRREYTVDQLALSFPAVALFVDRAQAVRYDFALTEDNAAAVETAGIWRLAAGHRAGGIPIWLPSRTRVGPALQVIDALGTGW